MRHDKDKNGYYDMSILFIAFSALSLVGTTALWFWDNTHKAILNKPLKKQTELVRELNNKDRMSASLSDADFNKTFHELD